MNAVMKKSAGHAGALFVARSVAAFHWQMTPFCFTNGATCHILF